MDIENMTSNGLLRLLLTQVLTNQQALLYAVLVDRPGWEETNERLAETAKLLRALEEARRT